MRTRAKASKNGGDIMAPAEQDTIALAEAIDGIFDRLAAGPLDRKQLSQAAEPYGLLTAAGAYLAFFRSLPPPRG